MHHRPRSLTLATVTAALGIIAGSGLAQPASSPPVDAKAPRALVEAVQKRLTTAPQFSVDITQKTSFEMMGQKNEFDVASNFSMDRPGRMALRHVSGMQGVTLVSDGRMLTYHIPMMKAYTQRDAPAKADQLLEVARLTELGVLDPGPIPFLSFFMSPTDAGSIGAAMNAGRIKVVKVGEPTLHGKKVMHLRLDTTTDVLGNVVPVPMANATETALELWIEPAKEPVLHRISLDLTAVLKAMAAEGEMVPDKVDMHLDFAKWSYAAPKDEAFAFVAPDDAKKYDSMMDALGEMAGDVDAGPDPGEKLLGRAAPAVSLEKLGGSTIDLASHRGEVVVLDFWATWCGPCVQALPILTEVTNSMAKDGVVFYAVNLRETDAQVQAFLEKKKLDFKVLMDRKGSVAESFFVSGIPQTVIIGKDGSVQAVHVGFMPGLKEKLASELRTLVDGGVLVEPAETP